MGRKLNLNLRKISFEQSFLAFNNKRYKEDYYNIQQLICKEGYRIMGYRRKITFMGAGSTIFAKSVLGDCILTPELAGSELALHDIDLERLDDSERMLTNINKNNGRPMEIASYENRKKALGGADYVINAIQVGGYRPATVTDFEVPKEYGLRQTIGDTIGIGGIFRTLRTIPVLLDFARDMEEVCPDALFMNYTNPMPSLTGALLKATDIDTVGLCHSVQVCVEELLEPLGMETEGVEAFIAGINHMAWLLKLERDGEDLYPEVKRRAREREPPHDDMVRYEIMKRFGYYITESSEHLAEYLPYFIKSTHPELIEEFNIPLDEYPRRCEEQLEEWEDRREELVNNSDIEHEKTREYASYMIKAMETDDPIRIGGNVLNEGLITNLPDSAVVEVPCLVDENGINPCHVGELPPQLAALNRTSINVHLLAEKAAMEQNKDALYQAALLDPHTSSELSIEETISLCDDLIEAHGDWLPELQ